MRAVLDPNLCDIGLSSESWRLHVGSGHAVTAPRSDLDIVGRGVEQLTRRRGTSSKDGIIIDHRRQADSSHSTPSSRELAAMAGSVQAHHSIQIVETSGSYRITAGDPVSG